MTMPHSRVQSLILLATLVASMALAGCDTAAMLGLLNDDMVRRSGQVELFAVDYTPVLEGDIVSVFAKHPELAHKRVVGVLRPAMTWDPPERHSLLGEDGESIRYSDDIITIQVHGGYLYSLPWTPLNSRDIVLFAEIWENASSGHSGRSLNSIVHIARSQLVPGRLNFDGTIAYGPTSFKGHPLKIKFTLMVLQRNRGQTVSNATDVLQNFVAAAGSPSLTTILSSEAIGVVRQVLRSLPDVVAFDFETTLISDEPESLQDTILDAPGLYTSYGGFGPKKQSSTSSPPDSDTTFSQSLTTNIATERSQRLRAMLFLELLRTLSETIYWDRFSPKQFRSAFDALAKDSTGSEWLIQSQFDPKDIHEYTSAIESHLTSQHPNDYNPDQPYDISNVPNLKGARDAIDDLDTKVIMEGLALLSQLGENDSSEHSESNPADRKPGANRINWLRYGTFALIETKARQSSSAPRNQKQYVETTDPFWYKNVLVFSNSLISRPNPSGASSPLQSTNANYLVFSIVPRQLDQSRESLRAASAISDHLLRMISTRPGIDPTTLADDVTTEFAATIDREALMAIARETARQFSGEDILEVMKSRHQGYIDGIRKKDDANVEVRIERAESTARAIQSSWKWRIQRHSESQHDGWLRSILRGISAG